MSACRNGTKNTISGDQVRAARGFLNWSRDDLVAACGVPKQTLIRFETSTADTRHAAVLAIRAALEAAGVEFIAENGGGPGVRLRKAAGLPLRAP
jgi:hypothetical protein